MFRLRDDAKQQLDVVNAKIIKAKTSLDIINEFDETKPLFIEFAGSIPLSMNHVGDDGEKR